jgi:hypothetical protein
VDRIDAGLLQLALADEAGGPSCGGAREEVLSLLAGVRDVEHTERRHRDGALGADADRPAALSEYLVALSVDEESGRGGRELPVARVANACRRPDREEAGSSDGEVERLVGLAQARRVEVRRDRVDPRAGVERADGLAGRRVLHQQRSEALLCRRVRLVAWRRCVGEVVGELVLPDLLSQHPLSGDVKARIHLPGCSAVLHDS